ncbi:MAG TPA: glycosyltransferase family 4 protein [Solirubrobacteraceae bacterium]|nr:glycosyltransferase family 4 protein [Solirubrobacteraceae bacterium]
MLFFNEGNLGAHVMGQGQLDAALAVGLRELSDVSARFAGLTPMGRVSRALAIRPLPLLAPLELDMRTLRWHAVQSLRARSAVERALAGESADVLLVHSHSVAMALGARMRATPTVLSLDVTVGDWSEMPAWRSEKRYGRALTAPSRALERRALERAALTIAWTGWARRRAETVAPGARVEELHPGIDLLRYLPAPRRPRERPRVLFVGGRFAAKGGPRLISALGDGLGETVELDVVTPEEVPKRPGVRVHRLQPDDPALLDLLQQADLLCLPTLGDAAPWAVLEAMACGTPVLATRVGGIPDMLEEGRAGALFEPGDDRELAEALSALLGDPGRRAELAVRARGRCERRYDARRQVPALIELMRGLTPSSP